MLTVWPDDRSAIVALVAPHDQTDADIYDFLLAALAVAVPAAERDKPPCCDEEGRPPVDLEVATEIADAVERHDRDHRRRR